MLKKLNGHTITVSDPDKYYFPASKITKNQLLDYYQAIAPRLLPYCRNRPVSMERYPGPATAKKTAFFQKHIPDYFPSWIKTVTVANLTNSGHPTYVLCQNPATLVYLANQACVTPHVWLSTTKNLTRPDQLIFDLDPAPTKNQIDFRPVKLAALALQQQLTARGLTAFVMTTGSRGLHVRVPLKPQHDFTVVREFARAIALQVVQAYPTLMTIDARKIHRRHKLLIDVMRNSYGATAVVPYAVRTRPGAPIATPLSWSELAAVDLSAHSYTLTHLNYQPDPWADWATSAGSLRLKI